MDKSSGLLPGLLDLLILKAVSLPAAARLWCAAADQPDFKGSLEYHPGLTYPALYRLEHQGLIVSEWGESENKRKARYYRLTVTGRKRLRDEEAGWNRLVKAIGAAMGATPEEV